MKIALFVHCFFPAHFYGTETYTLQVARQLRSMGHDPVVVSAAFPGEPRRESAVTTYRYDGLRVYCIDPGDMRTAMHQAAFPGEDIGDRPLPEERVPALVQLLEESLPSGRYEGSALLAPRDDTRRPGLVEMAS